MKKIVASAMVCLLSSIGLFACDTTNNNGATLTSIAITPVNQSITIGASQQFTATGTYSDSSTKIITSSVSWTSSDTSIATISNTGITTAVDAGTTTIKAMMGNISGTTTLTTTSAYSISGTVTSSGIGLQDVSMTLNSTATSTTDASGNYTFTGLANGSYTITPSKSGYAFNPAASTQTVNSAPIMGVNFSAVSTVSFQTLEKASVSPWSDNGWYLCSPVGNGMVKLLE